MHRFILSAALFVAAFAAPAGALALEPVYTSGLFDPVAISGADPVGYFTESRYVEGKEAFAAEWNGATWHFASAANRDAFLAEPERYAPQYGGYCAYAVSQGKTAGIDPEAWTIHGDKLYLNYSAKISNKWRQDIDAFIEAGDREWPKLLAD